MKIVRIYATLLGVIVFLFACGREHVAGGSADETLDAGIRVVNTGVGSWRAGEEWRLVPDLWIGVLVAEEGEEPREFGRLGQIAVDDWGRIFALDEMNHRVELFDSLGQHVRGFARQGQGPGEILRPNGIRLAPSGHLWIADIGNGRYTVFDSAGVFLRTYRRPITSRSREFRGGFDDEALIEVMAGLIRLDPRTEQVDTFRLTDPDPDRDQAGPWVFDRGSEQVHVLPPYLPGVHYTFSGTNLFWVGQPNRYSIALRTVAGDTVRIIEKEHTPHPVTDDDIERFLSRYPAHRQEIDIRRIPRTKPFSQGLFADDRGHLWVQTSPSVHEEPLPAALWRSEEIDVFDPDGRFLGTVQLGSAADALASAPGHVVEQLGSIVLRNVRVRRDDVEVDVSALPDSIITSMAVQRDRPILRIEAIRGENLYATLKGRMIQAIVRYRIEGRNGGP